MTSQSHGPTEAQRDLDSLFFDNLLHHTSDTIYFKDLQSRFIRMNDRQAHRFGIGSARQMIGKSDFDYFTEEHARQAYEDEQQIIASGEPIRDLEEKETWPDGRQTWVSTSKLPLRDRQGQIIGTFGISRDITAKKLTEQALQKSELQLREAMETIRSDLEQASRMHQTLLSDTLSEHPRMKFVYRYQPMEQIGGDYYTAQRLRGDDIGFFIGDMMGHGVSAALFIALLKFMFMQRIRRQGDDPAQLLGDLNGMVCEQMQMRFITAQYAHFACEENSPVVRMTLADAGHPQPFLQRAGSHTLEKVEVRGNAALGVTDQFQAKTVQMNLSPGDRLFFYTDGMYETVNESNSMLGEDAFLELFNKVSEGSLQEVVDDVQQGVRDFIGETPINDDWCLTGLEIC